MRSRLAKRIVSLVITMSILLVAGSNILAAIARPITDYSEGDTIAAGTAIYTPQNYYLSSKITITGASEPVYVPKDGTWTADQDYLVTQVEAYGEYYYDLTVKPSSDPGPQPQPSEPLPTSAFITGDTVPAGQELYDPEYESILWIGHLDANGDFVKDSKVKIKDVGGSWTADQNYLVFNTFYHAAVCYDLWLIPTGGASGGSSSSISPEQLRQMSINTFVENLYLCTLGRAYEEVGRSHWTEALNSNATGTEVAWGFFNSPEFLAMNLSNEDYVRVLYRVFCGNFTPDASQVAAWTAELDSERATRDQLFNQFAATQEWANICGYYAVNV